MLGFWRDLSVFWGVALIWCGVMLVDTHLLKRDGYVQGWRYPADPVPLVMGHYAGPKCPVVS